MRRVELVERLSVGCPTNDIRGERGRRSRTLTPWQRKSMGFVVPESAGLPGVGIVIACFQRVGCCRWLSERL